MKTVTSGENYTTVTVDTAEVVKFSFASTSLSVKVIEGEITVALTETAQAGDDGTITVSEGETEMFNHYRMNVDTYYLTGSGKAVLHASNMGEVNPFKKQARGGEITVTALSVTENGTYTAPTGTAYSPVSVDVPQGYMINGLQSGAMASFTDGTALPMPSLKVGIEPVQSGSGDPSPSNIRPISGRTAAEVTRAGKNLAKLSALTGSTAGYKDLTDNSVTVFSNTVGAVYRYAKFAIANTDKLKGQTLNFSCTVVNDSGDSTPRTLLRIIDSDGNAVGSSIFELTTFTISRSFTVPGDTPDECSLMLLLYSSSGGTGEQQKTWSDIQLELGSTATAYEPYAGTTYTIPFTDEQGQSVEVFGGSVDVVNGTSGNEKTKEGVDLSTLTWEVRYTGEVNQTVSSSLPSKYLQRTPVFMAEQYVRNGYVGEVASLNNPDERPIGIWNYQGSSSTETSTTTTIYMVVSKDTTPQGKLVYDIATPTTFYTQPTAVKSLLGSNNIWADTGDVIEGEYFSEGSDYMRETVLWENEGTTNPDTITLSEAWSNFDELVIVTDYIENNVNIWGYSTIKNTYNIGDNVRLWFYDQNVYAMYAVTSSTVLTKYAENGGDWVSKIIGIKY